MYLITKLLTFISGILIAAICLAGITSGIDESAKLPYWEWRNDDISLRLIQRLPDQSRAFFMGRKFSKENAELIAQSCMFQTIFKNSSNEKQSIIIEYNLNDWQIVNKNTNKRLKTREVWLEEWKTKNISQSSMIAFEWALLPTKQQYKYGDYNWGMTSFGLPPGSHFDLNIKILRNNQPVRITIPAIECAPDVRIGPGS